MSRKGATHWVIPDGYIPVDSSGKLISHESICVVNLHEQDAHIDITIYFEDQEPIEKISVTVKGKRAKHIRTSSLEKGSKKIPAGVPYALEIESDIPVIVQYSRLDTTQAELALMSTMAYPVDN
jgi:hypothetical protein